MASVLTRGSKGAAVRDLQRLLNATGAQLTIDGDFGGSTDQEVRKFQEKAGLVIDGKVGTQTLTALKRSTEALKAARPEPPKGGILAPAPDEMPAQAAAKPPPNASSAKILDTARPIHEIIVHCTATPEGKDYTVDDIRAWHRARGWSDCGYHYVVYRDGRIMAGRPIGQVGSHVQGHNTGSVGVSYIGGLTADARSSKDTRTDAQRASLLWLVEQIKKKFPIRKVTGHNEYAAKACPSFDVRKDPLSKLV